MNISSSPKIGSPFSSIMISLSPSPSRHIPTSDFLFLTSLEALSGNKDPHFSLILTPLGLSPKVSNSTPISNNTSGATL